MNSQNSLSSFLQRIGSDFPDIMFKKAGRFRWEPDSRTVFYDPMGSDHPEWSILHELGHAQLRHDKYPSDIALLLMEAEAWQAARGLANSYNIDIEQDYIEDCMDSYRDWLHKRSRCPQCQQNGTERSRGMYGCINCGAEWSVSASRFCRAYRKIKNTT